jgi:hypothetical protein
VWFPIREYIPAASESTCIQLGVRIRSHYTIKVILKQKQFLRSNVQYFKRYSWIFKFIPQFTVIYNKSSIITQAIFCNLKKKLEESIIHSTYCYRYVLTVDSKSAHYYIGTVTYSNGFQQKDVKIILKVHIRNVVRTEHQMSKRLQ